VHDLNSMFNHVRSPLKTNMSYEQTLLSTKLALNSSRVTSVSGAKLYQEASGSKCSKVPPLPLVEVPKAQVEHRICTSCLGGPGHAHPENV
jgi:hypothetical protein